MDSVIWQEVHRPSYVLNGALFACTCVCAIVDNGNTVHVLGAQTVLNVEPMQLSEQNGVEQLILACALFAHFLQYLAVCAVREDTGARMALFLLEHWSDDLLIQ